ncbi:hypothetical protein XELAEV_18040495mg [Xenopus laevis]|uniref:Uncharacterized protein n=1 Tax=Xenopus laevis TaxID=8355 RepID=A0A974H947_XENLA|nr:hypothetical protein XELAEV_18040495mg [Xenopus laevis]
MVTYFLFYLFPFGSRPFPCSVLLHVSLYCSLFISPVFISLQHISFLNSISFSAQYQFCCCSPPPASLLSSLLQLSQCILLINQ